MARKVFLLAVLSTVLAGCEGNIWTPGSPSAKLDPIAIGPSGIRRLTRREFDDTVADLLGDTSRPGTRLLPGDVGAPFDNEYREQATSEVHVTSLETASEQIAARAVADPVRRAALIGCIPKGPGDLDCFRDFARRFGRRALRRPVTDAEIARFQTLTAYSIRANDFNVGVEMLIGVIMQSPDFLYRVETGEPVAGKPGVFHLDSWEMAARLSYLLWGSTPDWQLLDAAQAGALTTRDQIRAAAQRLLADRRAIAQVQRFHALWLGYDQLPDPGSPGGELKQESNALVERILFSDRAAWPELFTLDETFVNDNLAKHYGLPLPGSTAGTWVAYGAWGRGGLLSHGSVLANGAKPADTSPTLRGLFVRKRLMCQEIPPPPPDANVDDIGSSTTSPCKSDQYAAHTRGGCASCHRHMDPIGFGLENYDKAGVYRTHDTGLPQCTIAGQGELVGIGSFRGPAELGKRLVESGSVQQCLVKQLFRFAAGREQTREEGPQLEALQQGFAGKGFQFEEMLLDFISSPAFAHRREES